MTDKDTPEDEPRNIRAAFEDDIVTLPISSLLPLKQITKTMLEKNHKYRQIRASIKEIGIIEPPVVAPTKKKSDKYMLLDGHLRIEALKELGETEVDCLVSTDDESFTYNKHVNRVSTIQEHKMILKAIELGVSEKRIAKALDVDVQSIVLRRKLLDGICPEVADMLKDKDVPVVTFGILKRMTPARQIEAATLMNDSETYSIDYARFLLAGSSENQLVNPVKSKKIKGLTQEQIDRMHQEIAKVQRDYELIKDSFGTDTLTLVAAKGYITTLIANKNVRGYLEKEQPDFLKKFQRISRMTSIADKEA